MNYLCLKKIMPYDLNKLTEDNVKYLTDEDLRKAALEFLNERDKARRETQIMFYRPVSEKARLIHQSTAGLIGIGGGNRSGKTESIMAEWVALATGIFPAGLEDEMRVKFRGPIKVRMCIESLKTVLTPTILPKLQWWRWEGEGLAGKGMGHWGWVPRICLKNMDWKTSWSEKLCTLTVLCRNPDNVEEILGESIIQFLSYDQDSTDYASGSFHIVHMDEPPPYAVWRENQARVMDVGGRIYLSMTWPDDPSVGVDWIYDEVYEPGLPGANKNPNIEWFDLYTTDNRHLNQDSVAAKSQEWSEEAKKVRLLGQPLRFSNRVHPLFTDVDTWWCFVCGKPIVPINGVCSGCQTGEPNIICYNHVKEFSVNDGWPYCYILDPHPRKPHMMMWVAIDPNDDLYVCHELDVDGDAADVSSAVSDIEKSLSLDVRLRLMDPQMGAQPLGGRRETTWQEEFVENGLMIDRADRSDVGRKRLNQFLKPDADTMQPRILFHPRSYNTILQMKRYVWDDFKHNANREQKQVAKQRYDDYPTMLKYLMNYSPSFNYLFGNAPIIKRAGRRGGY